MKLSIETIVDYLSILYDASGSKQGKKLEAAMSRYNNLRKHLLPVIKGEPIECVYQVYTNIASDVIDVLANEMCNALETNEPLVDIEDSATPETSVTLYALASFIKEHVVYFTPSNTIEEWAVCFLETYDKKLGIEDVDIELEYENPTPVEVSEAAMRSFIDAAINNCVFELAAKHIKHILVYRM